jgi:amino acid transporter
MFDRKRSREPAEDRTTTTGTAVADPSADETRVDDSRTDSTRTEDTRAAESRGRFGRTRTAAAGAGTGAITHEHVTDMRARQRDEYGGINWGAAFFGWLVAVGCAAILIGLVAGAGTAIGLTQLSAQDARGNAETIGLGGGIALLVCLMIAYYAGGYVAGRMSRFDGARQGGGAWIVGVVVTVILGALAAIFGSKYNVLEQLNLPRIPLSGETLTTGGLIAIVVALVGTLIAAVAGGKVGERYHRRVDRVAITD